MNFIIISPHFPPNFQNFSHRLRANGVNVLGIGDEPYENLSDELKGSLGEYFRVDSLENLDEVKRAVAFLFFKHGPIGGLESHNEYWLMLDAKLREQFNIPGLRPDDLLKFKYKSRMKKYFKEAGVPVLEGYVIKNDDDFKKAVEEISYPFVAKPDNGVGAGGTFKIENEDQAKDFLEKWDRSIEYFVEPYVEDGILCTYDGIVDLDGDIIFETGLYHTIPTLELVRDQLDLAFIVKSDLDPKIVEYGRAAVKAFGMKGRFFHIEFFKRADGSYIAIEYNSRVTGGYAIDVYNHAFAIDLYDIYARMVKGEKISKIAKAPHNALGLSQRDIYTYCHYEDDIRAKFGDRVKEASRAEKAFASIQGDFKYIITTDDVSEIDQIIDFVHKHKEN